MSSDSKKEIKNKIYKQISDKGTGALSNGSIVDDKTDFGPQNKTNTNPSWISEDENKLNREKTNFYKVLKWILGITIPLFLAAFLFYLSNVAQPVAKLEERTDELKESVRDIQGSLNKLEDSIKQLPQEN